MTEDLSDIDLRDYSVVGGDDRTESGAEDRQDRNDEE